MPLKILKKGRGQIMTNEMLKLKLTFSFLLPETEWLNGELDKRNTPPQILLCSPLSCSGSFTPTSNLSTASSCIPVLFTCSISILLGGSDSEMPGWVEVKPLLTASAIIVSSSLARLLTIVGIFGLNKANKDTISVGGCSAIRKREWFWSTYLEKPETSSVESRRSQAFTNLVDSSSSLATRSLHMCTHLYTSLCIAPTPNLGASAVNAILFHLLARVSQPPGPEPSAES